jgi:DNA polymerase
VSFESLQDIRKDLENCKGCPLCEGRKNIVFGEGNPNARLLFVGEGPGEEEDKQGRPFVGRAGQLLDKIIVAMGMKREDVYIANVVKCRPPKNRAPKPEEVEACTPFLERQIKAIRPKVICALGSSAAQHLLKTDVPVSVLRGRFHDRNGIPVMVTYHPAYLLRNPAAKKQVWEDMKKIMEIL